MFCNNCGTKNIKSAKFCKKCGVTFAENNTKLEPSKAERNTHQLVGLGGWLVIVGLSLFVIAIRYGYGIIEYYKLLSNPNVAAVSDPSSDSYMAGYFNLLFFEFVGYIAICASSIYLLKLYFQKKYTFIKYYKYLLIGTLIYGFIDYIFASALIPSEPFKKAMADSLNETAGLLGTNLPDNNYLGFLYE